MTDFRIFCIGYVVAQLICAVGIAIQAPLQKGIEGYAALFIFATSLGIGAVAFFGNLKKP